jgi:hydroxypyruvate reductase
MPGMTAISKPHGLAAIARHIYFKTLEEVNLASIIKDKIKLQGGSIIIAGEATSLDLFSEIVLISIGKASIAMAEAVESLLGDRITRGVVVTDRMRKAALKSEVIIAGHPLPNEESLIAGKRVMDLVSSCDKRALIIFAISGGGSALVEWPILPEISLEDIRKLNQVLIEGGASIRDINIIRKSLSAIKGGRLGYLARNLRKITLFASDVNPGDLESISSNPVLPESLSKEDLLEKLEGYNTGSTLHTLLSEIISDRVLERLPQQWREVGGNSIVLLSDNRDVIRAAAKQAADLECVVETDATNAEGDYKGIVELMVDRLRQLLAGHKGSTVCLISGGEASCVVRGAGFGGRNHEFALYAAMKLNDCFSKWAVLSCGTDGIDGNSNASGAVLDSLALQECESPGHDASQFLSISDSGSLVNRLGGQIVTGPTGNNLRDIRVFLAQ